MSARTGLPLGSPPFSAVREHQTSSGHPLDPSDFSILQSVRYEMDLDILEALEIMQNKPTLNSQLESSALHLF